ncbi:cation diffusion facilitator family transporter [Propionibacterium cyclohexanicum]|uniref:cation diffusion facilitator family transporter n=1 Tax=Propionibacterium cyclohexanicum TaxID=64702 RepID=UPI001FE04041|nr:cation diffusion facilitator family transporter [Propionibacterium cyclohexanicum]
MSSSPRYAEPVDLSKFAWLSIAAALATIGLKSWAAWTTGSVGLLSDALESLVNLVAAVVALFALKVSIKPPDDNHQFGHSKAEYFSAAVEGTMIFVAAMFIIYTGVERIANPRMPERLGVGLAVSMVASVINGVVGMVLLSQGRRRRSATLVADGRHLLTDVVTSVAVLVGVGLVMVTGVQILDPVVAILAGLNIIWIGYRLVHHSVEGLMDIALPPDVEAKIAEVLDRYRSTGDADFHAVRTRESGNHRFMEMHMLVPDEWTVKRGHDLAEDVIDALVLVEPDLRVSVHLEPKSDPKSYEDIDDV